MIWLLEQILREIPKGIHDWNKFIRVDELTRVMQTNGFINIEIKGLDLFGDTLYQNVLSYIRYKKTGSFKAKISENTSLMYIGKAVKAAQ
jgi:2-polyprenyl-6-hydroxyphenyl methylase/3-demethylubiquinone-9 3-methyltransferase